MPVSLDNSRSTQIYAWTDKGIDLIVDPNLSGELDHLNVTLLIVAASGQQTQATGFTFYAARARTQLTMFPWKQANLGFIPDAAGVYTVGLKFFSPPSSAAGATMEVNRWDQGRFGSANDSFSLNQLTPGFYTDTVEFWHFDMTPADCASDFYIDGSWNAWWDNAANAINVATHEQHCHVPPFGESTFYDYSWSHYALAVWVVGPRGVNPWPSNLH